MDNPKELITAIRDALETGDIAAAIEGLGLYLSHLEWADQDKARRVLAADEILSELEGRETGRASGEVHLEGF